MRGKKCARAAADRRVDHSARIIYPPAYCSLWFVGSAAVKNVTFFFLHVFFLALVGQMFAFD